MQLFVKTWLLQFIHQQSFAWIITGSPNNKLGVIRTCFDWLTNFWAKLKDLGTNQTKL